MIFNVSLYLQAVKGMPASEAGLWLILNVAGGLVGSLVGGLTMQATGKFYAITVGAYFMMFVGAGLILLMTDVFVQSLAGFAVGENFIAAKFRGADVALRADCYEYRQWFITLIHLKYTMLMLLCLGTGITTSLIALIANAGQADQAIATAG